MVIRTSVKLFLLCLTFDKPQPPSFFSVLYPLDVKFGRPEMSWSWWSMWRALDSLCVLVSVALWEIFSRVECSIAGILRFNSAHKRGEQEGVVAVFFPALWVIDSCVDEWKKQAHSCLHARRLIYMQQETLEDKYWEYLMQVKILWFAKMNGYSK